ncbi:Fanconi anemia group D2 protein homolog isoform X2 [Rhodamnia argentea]|uniref:Fanconi anemia group D2 protein homolog isoform X2 n=1 Tax=Rhodamnia argentea TaxID=178133 RepID=A0A8B8Q9Q4_9MYRT|nr:Fanconi anemia group D2 protein homolog isoform X2 [Rhodamnia argentea]
MVFLHQQGPSRKRNSSFNPPFSQSKLPRTTTDHPPPPPPPPPRPAVNEVAGASPEEKMVSILADAGCTLLNLDCPPCLPSDVHRFRAHLHRLLSAPSNDALRSDFVAGFSYHVQSPKNLLRVLTGSDNGGLLATRSNSLVRNLLLVPSIQVDLQNILLEKLPEFFDANPQPSGASLSLKDDVARLIINHLRWLDFIVDSNSFIDKLMQVLSICPLHLKKEIIGSLPEMIGDQNYDTVVNSLEQMLQEDTAIIVPVLDSLSNLHLDDQLKDQVVTIALSCLRTIDGEHMPFLLRFLLLSATPANVRRIISHIREQLKFIGVSNHHSSQHRKLKGKCVADGIEASILNTLRLGLRFKNILCQEILKEFDSLKRPQDHKVIDLWLIMVMYMNGDSVQKSIKKIFKRKIVDDCIPLEMIDQCLHGHANLVLDYFPSFLSLCEYIFSCKEHKARTFGIHMYTCLFEEVADPYSRQEIIGALVTHVGSGVNLEVGSALETMNLLVAKHPLELIRLSSYINGILDFLEGFSMENLYKVYEVFSNLALSVRSSQDSMGSSFANELLIVVRKQVNHPDMNYKKMGLIGSLKIVSCIGDANNILSPDPSLKSNVEEALELLETCLKSCKQLALPLTLFYDEMTALLSQRNLHPAIMEWIGKNAGELESIYLLDLEDGKLPLNDSYGGLEGELWMNLDGDISPICVNILPLTSSSLQSPLLQILPANILLLSTVERSTNQGSLGGIDALLGCPLHLPSSKYFSKAVWQSLTGKQKQIVCLSLYYAANWIRELLNAFSTQVAGKFECTSQATKEDIINKLLKRLRNLVFLESLLNNHLESYPLCLPELHLHLEQPKSSNLSQLYPVGHLKKKNELKRAHDLTFPNKCEKMTDSEPSSCADRKLHQPTIVDVLNKARVMTSPEVQNDDSSSPHMNGGRTTLEDQHTCDSDEKLTLEISAATTVLELQRSKFRPLLLQCYSILAFSKKEETCCSDPMAELPLCLYLLRDLHKKLDYFKTTCNGCAASGFAGVTLEEFLLKIRPLFPSLKRHLDSAMSILEEGDHNCRGHWKDQSINAGNPNLPDCVLTVTSATTFLIKEVLHCLSEMLNLPDIQRDTTILSDLLRAFQPLEMPDSNISGMQPRPMPGSIEYLYCGAYSFLENILDSACSFSIMTASETLLTLEAALSSAQKFNSKLIGANCKFPQSGFNQDVLLNLRRRLGICAEKILKHRWDAENVENNWKSKGDRVHKVLHVYLGNSESTTNVLNELALSVLPQALVCKMDESDVHHGFACLCSATFHVWYRVLHEVNLIRFNDLVKEVGLRSKSDAGRLGKDATHDVVRGLLIKLLEPVNVVVSLVNMCRTCDKVTMHAMAVKYGGKFVDSFLKVLEFLELQFQAHQELVIQLVKELQKATRTLQTLCSEAKGLKQMSITSKIPAMKRSLERLLFRVKALLHNPSSGCAFWMGNLKHKDLAGQVVSSQAYNDEQDFSVGEDARGEDADEPPLGEPDEETEQG